MNMEKVKNMDMFELKEFLTSLVERRDNILSRNPKIIKLYGNELKKLERDISQIFGYIEDKKLVI